MIPLHVIEFCAKECEHQQSGEMSVYHMVKAWNNACLMTPPIVVDDILRLGRHVEPGKNQYGFRTVVVSVGRDLISPNNIASQVVNLCTHGTELTPAEFYKAFEEIHPFIDGNGRVGQLLFNILNGTIHNPEFAPNFWNT